MNDPIANIDRYGLADLPVLTVTATVIQRSMPSVSAQFINVATRLPVLATLAAHGAEVAGNAINGAIVAKSVGNEIANEVLNPIFDRKGNMLGTDDKGLQGMAFIMNKEDFKQGMSHEEALMKNIGIAGLLNRKVVDNLLANYESLSSRPDWDGYLTLREANQWYRTGGGRPLFVALNKIDLSRIYSLGEKYVKQEKSFNLLFTSGPSNDGLVYGSITLKRYPNNQVRAYSDNYGFEMHNPYNPLNWGRNIETFFGKIFAGLGIPFEINIYGSATLAPLFPWTK